MIKLFRHIRKSLLMENKTGKYFKYAIGEILLVMIGILLALQVSNWNENRNLLKQEHKILLSLQADFKESHKRLLETMNMQKNVVRKSSELIKVYQGEIRRPSNDTIMNYVAYGAFGWYRAELLTGAYDSYINTGNSELIRNEKLTKMLAEYFSILKSGFEDQENSMSLLNKIQSNVESVMLHLAPSYLKKRIGLEAVKDLKENEAIDFLFKQDAFFGNLYNKNIMEWNRYFRQQEMLGKITNILTLLNKEIALHN